MWMMSGFSALEGFKLSTTDDAKNTKTSSTDDTKRIEVRNEVVKEEVKDRPVNLAILPSGSPVIPMRWEIESMEWNAKNLQLGKMLPKSLTEGRSAAEAYNAALSIIGRGREVGIPPQASLERIKWINNTPTLDAEGKWGIVINYINNLYKEYQKKGMSETEIDKILPHLDVIEHTDKRCVIEGNRPPIFRKTQTYTWTIEMAKKIVVMEKGKEIKLAEKQTWKNYEHDMLMSRCKAEICRQMWPDLTMGISYTGEEAESFSEENMPDYKQHTINVPFTDTPAKPMETDDLDFSKPKEFETKEIKTFDTPKTITGVIKDQTIDSFHFIPAGSQTEYLINRSLCETGVNPDRSDKITLSQKDWDIIINGEKKEEKKPEPTMTQTKTVLGDDLKLHKAATTIPAVFDDDILEGK